ncbi:MAG: hypothetical protein ACRECL_12840 [Bradyrhizobium sp.]
MAFFKRDVGPVERFENALKGKQAERRRLADRLSLAESVLGEKRTAAERLAVAGASNASLERAEARLRSVEDRTKALRAALAEFDEQVVATERALAEAREQRDRELMADRIEALAASIELAVPGFGVGAAMLVDAVAKNAASVPEASRFAASVDAVRCEVLSAADLICWELRTMAVRTRAGNANLALPAPLETGRPALPEIERQMIFTLNALKWQEGGEARKAPAFALVELPRALLSVALSYQHADHLNARRVQTLMHIHGSGENASDAALDDGQLVDLDALAAMEQERARADVA